MLKAVVFDIDNTLTHDVSWLRITDLLGASVAEHERIFQAFSVGSLPYEQAKAQLIHLWRSTGNARKSYWQELFQDWPLVADARHVATALSERGYEPAIITGSLDIFAASIAHTLQIEHWYANTTTEWNTAGELVDFHYVQDQAAQKLAHLQLFCREVGVEPTECAAIGDGENDVEVFRATQHGISVGQDNTALQDVAWKQAATLSDILSIL